ncbi:hypothetical protein HanRHA438_Chr06g0274381 [Helianthus annuus]|uniref:Uncharacterized protein n=1 Tax=Helianthus annuus TaxID=4232 RepID=A0A251UM36_HELAN|nr:uncharacterized protein LOC110865725 [Helianthus annuus]KAF5802930.1 hypothetical protein HanXRQr2_Chr06g0265331 [Helianthus annuus]KAJ0560976.1 hypothetical protein HanHA300_Chr06g0217541 [Helianthus annuus]KAJ0567483.1 hypothetical protein HanIR_Chr06g0285311 [Helianthus annuus]KAJ0574015.1 hypothetical protein HanHA89_Chr06g0233341 [Helianthus annuus]KAJ0738349.1 hypothetical protein HanLR1_Chr06g0217271 [Helianthus annuus]
MMSKQQDQQALNVPYTTPIIMEHDHEGKDIPHDNDDVVLTSNGCFHLFFCCFDNHHNLYQDGETAGFLYQKQSGDLINQDTWFMKRAKSLKEYSELVAGPKWKNFIRRFSRRRNRSNANTTPFQYDPKSYALNFNDAGNHDEDDDLLPRSFSTRFAPPSRSTQL